MKNKNIQYMKISSIFTKSTLILFIFLLLSNMFIISILFNTSSLDSSLSKYEKMISESLEYDGISFNIRSDCKDVIIKENLWLQVVDNSLHEVYSYNTPTEVPKDYTPINFIHSYKYNIGNTSVFIYEKTINKKNYSYFIGIPIDKVAKYNIQYNPSSLKNIMNKFIFIFILNILVIVNFSYFYFSKKTGKPLQKIINQIITLSEGDYTTTLKEDGMYKNIYKCLNTLTESLRKNKNEKYLLDKNREKWISYLSHDMKTPISSIKGFAELLKDNNYDFTQIEIKNYISIIYDKCLYLEQLINDLNFSYKLKNNSVPINIQVLNLTNFLNNLIQELLSAPEFFDKSISFNEFKDTVLINADIHLLKRAFSNLIINFLIYNSSGTQISITIQENSNNIELYIKDNGRGIPREDLEYIFDQYYRGTNTTSNSNGSGLGLAIANEIILLHKGSCEMHSLIGVGTTLKVSLKKH